MARMPSVNSAFVSGVQPVGDGGRVGSGSGGGVGGGAGGGAGALLFLPLKAFNSTMARHPELKDELSKITADRIKQTKEALDPEDEDFLLIEDDDLILL